MQPPHLLLEQCRQKLETRDLYLNEGNRKCVKWLLGNGVWQRKQEEEEECQRGVTWGGRDVQARSVKLKRFCSVGREADILGPWDIQSRDQHQGTVAQGGNEDETKIISRASCWPPPLLGQLCRKLRRNLLAPSVYALPRSARRWPPLTMLFHSSCQPSFSLRLSPAPLCPSHS